MKKIGSVGIALCASLALSACVVPPWQELMATPMTGQSLVGIDWVAVSIDGVVPVISPLPTMRWDSVDQITGSGGCNSFGGKAVLKYGDLRIGPLAALGRACLSAPTGQEDMFFKALEHTRKVRLEDEQLVLLDQTGKTVARLVQLTPRAP